MNQHEVAELLDRISETALMLKSELRWGRNISHTGDRVSREDGAKIPPKGEMSDPTGNMATDRARQRFARAVKKSEGLIDKAWGELDRVMNGGSVSRRTTGAAHQGGSFLRPGELDRLTSAQARRDQRGEGHGA